MHAFCLAHLLLLYSAVAAPRNISDRRPESLPAKKDPRFSVNAVQLRQKLEKNAQESNWRLYISIAAPS